MARSINEIKQEIITAFNSSDYADIHAKMQYDPNAAFESQKSKVSVLNLLFYIVAATAWVLETLFNKHRQDVEDRLAELVPHTLLWYQQKARSFLLGLPLIEGTDKYDTLELADSQIETAQVIRYAACESKYGKIKVKIAGGNNSNRQPIQQSQLVAFTEYMQQVKDAGVMLEIINLPADNIKIDMSIYYSPLYLTINDDSNDLNSVDGSKSGIIRPLITSFVANLPFNGVYSNQALMDVLQKEQGVVIADLHSSQSKIDGSLNWYAITAFIRPESGYFKVINPSDLTLNFIPYNEN